MNLVTGDLNFWNNNLYPHEQYRYAHEPIYQDFPNQAGLIRKITFDRTGDKIKPEYLIVKQPELDINIKNIDIEIAGRKIISIDIDFMIQIYPDMVQFRNGKTRYKLYMDKWISDYIPLVALQFSSVSMSVHLSNQNLSSIKVMSDYIFLDNTPRSQLAQQEQINRILQYESTIQENIDNSNSVITLNHHGYINGLFIETDTNIDNITRLQLLINNFPMRDLDEFQLEHLIKKINNNMFYLPFTNVANFFAMDNLHGGLNLNRINNTQVKLTGNQQFVRVKIHSLMTNIISYHSTAQLLGGYIYGTPYLNSLHSYTPPVQQIIQLTTSYKIYTGDDVCLISLSNIESGTKYRECHSCSKAFINEYITQWLTDNNNCPHCRTG